MAYPADLCPIEGEVLVALNASAMSVEELCKCVPLEHGTMVAMLTRMEQKGYVNELAGLDWQITNLGQKTFGRRAPARTPNMPGMGSSQLETY